MAGAPLGNRNGVKAKPWTAAINRALERRSLVSQKSELDQLADKLIDRCLGGDLASLQELGNRLEGKPAQSIMVAGDDESPLNLSVKVELVAASRL
jgi:hypothetical protein